MKVIRAPMGLGTYIELRLDDVPTELFFEFLKKPFDDPLEMLSVAEEWFTNRGYPVFMETNFFMWKLVIKMLRYKLKYNV